MAERVHRRRDVVPLAVGVTLVVAYVGRMLSPWGPWAAPFVGAGLAGWFIGNWHDGSGAGGYAAGIGGFVFVAVNFREEGLVTATKYGLFSFLLFAVVGLVAGAVGGLAHSLWRAEESDAADDGEAAATDSADDGESTGRDDGAESADEGSMRVD